MNRNGEQWRAVLDCNEILRQRLMTWEVLLCKLTDGGCRSDKRLLAVLEQTLDLLDDGIERVCAAEETGPLPYAEEKFPRMRLLVEEVWREHQALRAQVQAMKMELNSAAGPTLRATGMELVQAVRAHICRNEEELIPALTDVCASITAATPTEGYVGAG
ncbi:MAG TPA: hemerythrin domain-containing protein [Terriglobales bacterium]|nr:hemerythrin domain-containing protein [Terriglobales bacterium]